MSVGALLLPGQTMRCEHFPLLQGVEAELERIEEQIFAAIAPRANIEALYALKHRLMLFRHAVVPLLESLGNISGARVPLACGGMQEYFRDVSDHLQRLNQAIESIRDRVSTAISVNLSMITLQESENYILYRLRKARWL